MCCVGGQGERGEGGRHSTLQASDCLSSSGAVFFVFAILVLVVQGESIPVLKEHRHPKRHAHRVDTPDIEKALPMAPEADLRSFFIGIHIPAHVPFAFSPAVVQCRLQDFHQGTGTGAWMPSRVSSAVSVVIG